MKMYKPVFTSLIFAGMLLFLLGLATPSRAEILNDDEFGWMEIIDFSVIEDAAGMFTPVGLSFNVSRGGYLHPGEEIMIRYRGQHDRYASLIDFSPDRIVKLLVMNEYTSLRDGHLARSYYGTLGDALGMEYIMLVISDLPLTDERLEELALAPNEIQLDTRILSVSVNDFNVVSYGRNPNRVVEWGESLHDTRVEGNFIPLEDMGIDLGYPLNTYPYNPWRYMYLYPYPVFRPEVYRQQYGPFSKTWYVFPQGNTLANNFWDYTTAGWIDNGNFVIPPGGYWRGTFRADDPYASYFMRVLPYLARENESYLNLQIEINGTLVQPSIDITQAIGWGEYWTTDPFAYYDLSRLLRTGDNTVYLYWPETMDENLELQMMDMVPSEIAEAEFDEAAQAAAASEENEVVE